MPDSETSGEIERIRIETRRDRRKDAYWWVVMVVTAVVGPALAIGYSAYNTNQSERKFCKLMAVSVIQARSRVEGFKAVPPTTAAGRTQQSNAAESVDLLTDLQRSLGCPNRSTA
jgi:hypothetical protein